MIRRHLLSALHVVTGIVRLHDTKSRRQRELQQRRHFAGAKMRAWSRDPTIQGFGVACRVKGGKRTSQLVLKVYVEQKVPRRELRNAVPRSIRIPGIAQPIPVDVEAIGRVRLHMHTGWIRPAQPGYSIGPEGGAPGTLGCVVRRYAVPGASFVLSNYHVLTAEGRLSVGAELFQPAPADGRGPQNPIATLDSWIPIRYDTEGFPNLVDAAIGRILNESDVTPMIAEIGGPDGVNTNVAAGMEVRLAGRSTDRASGVVRDVNFHVLVEYPLPDGGTVPIGFSDQVMCDQFASAGDSGAAVLDRGGNVVGLYALGSSSVSVFNKIGNVLSLLNAYVLTA